MTLKKTRSMAHFTHGLRLVRLRKSEKVEATVCLSMCVCVCVRVASETHTSTCIYRHRLYTHKDNLVEIVPKEESY